MKKRAVSLILGTIIAFSAIFSLSSCQNREDSADVHVFYYTYSDTYITSVRAALDKAFEDMQISYQDYDSNSNQTTQTEQVQTAITKGAKLIVVNIVNTGSDDASSGIVQLAKNANIPVIFFNREVSDEVVNSYDKCIFVGTDAAEAGHLQGEMIGEYLIDNFDTVDLNGDGKISYILFKGEEGNNEAIYRTKFAVEDADKILTDNGYEPLEFYDSANTNKYHVDQQGKWSAQAANEYMTTALTAYNEANDNMIELVICNNDGMAEGAVSALSSSGFNTGNGKSIPVFGVDATDSAKQLIAENKMTGTIKQDAEGMAKAIAHIADNGIHAKDLMDATEGYNVDEKASKVRIAYAKYLGE